MKKLSVLVVLLFAQIYCLAQLPDCTANPSTIIYIHNGSNIYNYDVTLPISATNPSLNTITMPSGGGGLAVSNNLNAATPSPTFYTTVSGNYHYYDGTTWVNTGHSAGAGGAVNSGGGGNFLYNLVGFSGEVYKYDGTGNATLLLTVPGFNGGGPYDLVGDCDGGFYILRINASNPFLRKYSSTGTLVSSWPVTGTSGSAGGGFAIVADSVYYHSGSFNNAFFAPPASNLAFSNISSTIPNPSDMACCPVCAPTGPVADFSMSEDTICQGASVNFTDLSSQNPNSWSWTFNTGTPSTSTLQNPMGVIFNTAGTHNITLVVSDGSSNDTITKQIYVAPQISASISGKNEICLGDATTLTAAPNGNNYLWTTTETTQNITKSPLATTTYKVYVNNVACIDSAEYTVAVNPLPDVSATTTLTRCDMNSGSATAMGNLGTPGYTYAWSNGSSDATATDLGVGNYTVTVTDSKNCTATTSVSVSMYPNPTATVSPYPVGSVRVGESIQLSASGGQNYSWSPETFLSCTNCANPLSTPIVEEIKYCVEVIDNNGCSDTACTTILVDTTCSAIFVPNAFSPNDDTNNDDIGITNICPFNKVRFAIFNRWGEKVFETNDPNIRWDGTYKGQPQPISTYYYYLDVELINGRQVVRRGDITLIR